MPTDAAGPTSPGSWRDRGARVRGRRRRGSDAAASGGRWLLPAVVAAVVLLAVVAGLAADGGGVGRSPSASGGSRGHFPTALGEIVAAGLVVVAILGIVLIVGSIGVSKRRGRIDGGGARGLLLILAALFLLLYLHPFHRIKARRTTQRPATGRLRPPLHRPAIVAPVHVEIWPLVVVGLLLVLAVAALVHRARARTEPRRATPRTEEERAVLDDALAESLEDLAVEPDVRRAVILAYRHFDRALVASGRARRPEESARELAERLAGSLDLPVAALVELTDLFERARYAPRPLDEGARDRAIAAVTSLRAALGPAPASARPDEPVRA